MTTLYADRQGAVLGLEQGQFTLKGPDEQCDRFPEALVDQVMLYGRVQITHAALQWLLRRGVALGILTGSGRLLGRLVGPVDPHVDRRMGQFTAHNDPQRALTMARHLVVLKLRNQARVLQRVQASEPHLRPLILQAQQVSTMESLRGVEGLAARYYFGCFPQLLDGSPFTFTGRNRRPPRDPVNAMLSLGYALLEGELRSAVETAGLDPYLGVYHVSDARQPACVLDLMEPLRPLVDRLVLRLARHDMRLDDFTLSEPEGCHLADRHRGKFYSAWETWLAESLHWYGQLLNYRQLIHEQAIEWRRWIADPQYAVKLLAMRDIGY